MQDVQIHEGIRQQDIAVFAFVNFRAFGAYRKSLTHHISTFLTGLEPMPVQIIFPTKVAAKAPSLSSFAEDDEAADKAESDISSDEESGAEAEEQSMRLL